MGIRQQQLPDKEEGAEGTVGTCSSHGGHGQPAGHCGSVQNTVLLPQPSGTLLCKRLQQPRLPNRHSMTLPSTNCKEKAFRMGKPKHQPCLLALAETGPGKVTAFSPAHEQKGPRKCYPLQTPRRARRHLCTAEGLKPLGQPSLRNFPCLTGIMLSGSLLFSWLSIP